MIRRFVRSSKVRTEMRIAGAASLRVRSADFCKEALELGGMLRIVPQRDSALQNVAYLTYLNGKLRFLVLSFTRACSSGISG